MFSERSAIDERDFLGAMDAGDPLEHVVPTAGGVLASLLLLCDPGDEALMPEPSHPSVAHAAQLAGVSLAPYPLRYEDGRWGIDSAALWDAIGERTRAVLASSPNDITGALLSEEELELLDSLGIPLVLDRRLARHPLEARGVAASIEATSLRLTLDGDEAGEWIAVSGPHAQVHEALARLAPIARALGVPAPTTLDPIARARASLTALREELAGSALEVPPVDAGWNAPIKLPPGAPDEEWAQRLREHGLIAAPGSSLAFPDEERWLVLGLLADPEQVRLAARALRELSKP